jgi:hypothetical protein
MDTKKLRSRIVTGCLATMLLPAGAGIAKSEIAPGFEPSSAAAERRFPILTGGLFRAGVLGGAFAFGDLRGLSADKLGADSGASPWFRKTFELFGADVTPPVERPAATPLPAPTLEAPGVVQNVRRADRR